MDSYFVQTRGVSIWEGGFSLGVAHNGGDSAALSQHFQRVAQTGQHEARVTSRD